MADAEQARYSARVYLTEARNRRRSSVDRDFYWTLLRWAGNARRRAISLPMQATVSPAPVPAQPAQLELFA